MIQVICDKCGCNCDKNAFEIQVSLIQNPAPLYALDIGDLKITNDNSRYRFILCQTCYRKTGFPNIYEVCETGELDFRDEQVKEDSKLL